MDTGFFSSRYFLIFGAVAGMIVAGAAAVYAWGGNAESFGSWDACDAPSLTGTALTVAPARLVDDDGRRRSETYALDASSYVGGALKLCVDVGEILVEPAAGDELRLEITTYGDHERAVSETRTEARFLADGDKLVVGVWESVRGESRTLFSGHGAAVRVVLHVPPSGAYAVEAANDVGDVRIVGLMVEEARVSTDVGNSIVRDVDLIGNATVTSDVGDAILHATSVTTGKILVRSDVGNAEADLPLRADVGYDAKASTDVGEASLQIGDVEAHDSQGDGPGEILTARSSGFASKPTRVVVEAVTDVGDARLAAS